MNTEPSHVSSPLSVKLVCSVVLLEALAVLAYGINYLLNIGEAGALNMGGRIFMVVICLAAAAWQVHVARGLLLARAWTRAPIVAWQLFQIILGVTYLQTALWPAAAAALVAAAVALIFTFAPQTTAFFGDRRPAS